MGTENREAPRGIKTLAAVIGGAAVLAMGALTVAVSETTGGDVVGSGPEATIGETSTKSTAPPTLETPFATPPITSTEAEG